jgi:hypothetical protein
MLWEIAGEQAAHTWSGVCSLLSLRPSNRITISIHQLLQLGWSPDAKEHLVAILWHKRNSCRQDSALGVNRRTIEDKISHYKKVISSVKIYHNLSLIQVSVFHVVSFTCTISHHNILPIFSFLITIAWDIFCVKEGLTTLLTDRLKKPSRLAFLMYRLNKHINITG